MPDSLTDAAPPPDLSELLADLRAEEFKIGVQEVVAVHRAVLVYARREWRTLDTVVGPIVCGSEREQDRFPALFRAWLERSSPQAAATLTPRTEPGVVDLANAMAANKRRRQRLTILVSMAVLLAVGLLIGILRLTAPKVVEEPPAPPPIEVEAPQPAAEVPDAAPKIVTDSDRQPGEGPPTVDQLGADSEPPQSNEPRQVWLWMWLAMGLAAIPFAAVLTWRKLIDRQSKSLAAPPARRVERTRLPFRDLFLPRLESGTFGRGTMSRLAADFRRHREVKSGRLDVDRTIRRTISNGGLPQPVRGMRRVSPEYLVLVDRRSYRDHLAWYVEEMLEQLTNGGVYLELYEFQGDPRAVWKPGERQARRLPQSLQSLIGPYSGHRLLVMASAEVLINPLTNRVADWAEIFHEWPRRALFTDRPPADWNWAEERVSKRGFQIFPADLSGLSAFIAGINRTRPDGEWLGQQSPRLPGILAQWNHLAQDEDVWDDDPAAEPGEQSNQAIVSAMRSFLGADGFSWACACAAAPSLDWTFTLYLGHNLTGADGNPLMSNDRLRALAALPWFRTGAFPDWLRERLVREISEAERQEVRQIVGYLLLSASPESPLRGYRIDSSVAGDEVAANALDAVVEQAHPDSAIRDRTFSGILSRAKSSAALTRSQAVQVLVALGLALSASGYLWFAIEEPGKVAWWIWGFGVVYVIATAACLWENLLASGWPHARLKGLFATVVGAIALAVGAAAFIDYRHSKAGAGALTTELPAGLARFPEHVRRELVLPESLREGASSPYVRRAQEWLNLHGLRTPIDGHFRRTTKSNVERFQRRRGLEVSGVIDEPTWKALTEPLRAALAPLPQASLTLNEMIARVARQHFDQSPRDVGGLNEGPWVRVYCGGHDGPKWYWDTGFTSFVIRQACRNLDRPPPFEPSVNVDTLGARARQAGLLVRDGDVFAGQLQIAPGDVFLGNPPGPDDWSDSGIVTARDPATTYQGGQPFEATIPIQASPGKPTTAFAGIQARASKQATRWSTRLERVSFNLDGGDYEFIRWAWRID